jgi:predicted acylesterase/phospholipase RssA
MGESPQAINGAIDSIPRYRRMYLDGRDDIPKHFRDFSLGQAVGASAAVPGVFEPIVLRKLYPGRTVRLADGGVHDNQGLASLLEQSCNVLLVSDASGQMDQNLNPGGGVISVASRTNTILQARVRDAQFNELQSLQRSGSIDGAMFIHLTKDLEADSVSFDGAPDVDEVPQKRSETTSYGVDRKVQKQLAEIRTDLDSFSDAEAYGLMMSAYLMTEHALQTEKCAPTLPFQEKLAQWRFLRVREALTDVRSSDNHRMRRLLAASKELALKAWKQVLVLKVLFASFGLAALVSAVVGVLRFWKRPPSSFALPSGKQLTIAAAVIVLVIAIRYVADKKLQFQKRFGEFFLGIGLASAGLVASWFHLVVTDQIFLWYGRWEEKPPSSSSSTFAPPGSPRLPIKASVPAPPPKQPWTPVVRRILNLF